MQPDDSRRERRSLRQSALWALVAVLVLVAALIQTSRGSSRPDRGDPSHATPDPETAVDDVAASSQPSSATALVRGPARELPATIVCVASDRVIRDVIAYVARAGDRLLTRDAVQDCLRPDSEGRLVVTKDRSAPPDGGVLVLLAPGYGPESLPLPLGPGEHRVQMHPCGRVTVTVRDGANRPVPGVGITLSRAVFPFGWEHQSREWAGSVPGVDPKTAIHYAVSDEAGVATFSSCSSGDYLTGIATGDRVILRSTLRPSITLDGAAKELGVHLGFVAYAFVEVRGDVILGCRRDYDRGLVGSALNDSTTSRLKDAASAARPALHVDVVAAKVERPFAVRTTLLLERCGERVFDVQYANDPNASVQVLDLAGDSVAARTGKLTVHVVDPSGSRMPSLPLFLQTTTDPRHPIGVPIVSGQAKALPKGQYRLVTMFSWLERSVRKIPPIDVDSDTVVEVTCDKSMRECELSIADQSGKVPAGAVVTCRAGAFETIFESRQPGSIPVWLPVGEVSVEVSCAGWAKVVKRLDVPAAMPTPELLKIPIALE